MRTLLNVFIRSQVFVLILLSGCIEPGEQLPDEQQEETGVSAADKLSHGSLANNPCAIFNGRIKCWGEDIYGILGLGGANSIGSGNNIGDDPGEMGINLGEILVSSNLNVVSLAHNNAHSRCALFQNGSVKCWGHNGNSQLGLGDLVDRSDPSQMGDNLEFVDLGTGRTAITVTAGNRHYCALLDNGTVKCWGDFTSSTYFAGNPGFVGDTASDMGDNLAAVNIPIGTGVRGLASGDHSNCAMVDGNDNIFCWSKQCSSDSGNFNGPTFTCNELSGSNWLPVGILDLGGRIESIAMNHALACAIFASGGVRCWGLNHAGQLGQGHTATNTTNLSSIPFIDLGTGRTATQISVGTDHACALLDDGSVKCWGENDQGELGLGDTNNRGDNAGEMGDSLPAVDLGTGRTALEISAFIESTCAILDDRSVKCWGANPQGRLGQGHESIIGDMANQMGDFLETVKLW